MNCDEFLHNKIFFVISILYIKYFLMINFIFFSRVFLGNLIVCQRILFCSRYHQLSFDIKVVTIDLKEDAFTPGKRNYERVRDCLNNNFDEKFDVIFLWDPPGKHLCPSSAAAWFHQRGHKVSLCRQKYSNFFEDSFKIPLLNEVCDEREFFEWLGIFSIGGDVKNEDPENYLNSYTCPLQNVIDGKIICAEWTGLFSIKRLHNIYESIENYLASNNNTSTSWMSLHVHGFADSPVSWCLKEHSYYTDGDNSFTIVFQRNGEQIIQKSLSSNNKPRIVQ